MEASALHPPPAVGRISLPAPLLRLRTDDQLVALFRAGQDAAFLAIHERYRQRLFAYTRQMLSGSRQDAEDALQDVFLRAYSALRADERPLSLRAWLYRVAHNRCIDQLRRPIPAQADVVDALRAPLHDPIAEAQRRDDLQRLVEDVRRLPGAQRSALLMREWEGLSYEELSAALETTVPAIKSLLVRARIGLVEAAEAREVGCVEIRHQLATAYDKGVRATGQARRHMRECAGCREYRDGLRDVRKAFAAIVPVGFWPLALLAKLGLSGSGAAAGGGATASGGGSIALGGASIATAGKVAALVASVAVVTAGAANEVQQATAPPPRPAHHHAVASVPVRHDPLLAALAPALGAALPPALPAKPAPAKKQKPRPAAPAQPTPPATVPAVATPADATGTVPVSDTTATGTDPTIDLSQTGGAQAPADAVTTDGTGTADPATGATDPAATTTVAPATGATGPATPVTPAAGGGPGATSSSTGSQPASSGQSGSGAPPASGSSAGGGRPATS